jgi:beta-phosphoglucomutase
LIQAVLFDFDGVLAETIQQHLTAWQEVLRKDYFEPDGLVLRLNEGQPARMMTQALFQHAGMEVSNQEARRLGDLKNEAFRRFEKPRVFPQIFSILDMLHAHHLRTAVVTGTKLANLKHVLGDQLLQRFDAVIQDGDYAQPKPDPEPFLQAAKRLGVAAADCMVVENAPHGIRAAKEAGMFCLAVMTTLPREPLAGADVIIKDHDALRMELHRLLSIAG